MYVADSQNLYLSSSPAQGPRAARTIRDWGVAPTPPVGFQGGGAEPHWGPVGRPPAAFGPRKVAPPALSVPGEGGYPPGLLVYV